MSQLNACEFPQTCVCNFTVIGLISGKRAKMDGDHEWRGARSNTTALKLVLCIKVAAPGPTVHSKCQGWVEDRCTTTLRCWEENMNSSLDLLWNVLCSSLKVLYRFLYQPESNHIDMICRGATVVQEVEKSFSNQKVASSIPCLTPEPLIEHWTPNCSWCAVCHQCKCKMCIHCKSHICKSLWIKASAKRLNVNVNHCCDLWVQWDVMWYCLFSLVPQERESLNSNIVNSINQASDDWGIRCLRYEIKDIQVPQRVKDSMQLQVRVTQSHCWFWVTATCWFLKCEIENMLPACRCRDDRHP